MNAADREGGDEAARTVEWICSFAERKPGTDAERRLGEALAGRLRAGGRSAAVESTYVHPQWPAVHLLHCVLAIAGSLLATVAPVVGFGLLLVAASSLYLDLAGRWYLLRRLFFRRVSQNVVSPPLAAEPEDRVLICAHYDAPLTGAAYKPWAIAGLVRLLRLWPLATSPQSILFWSMALLVPLLGLRMAGIEGNWLSLLQLPGTVILIVSAFLLGEIGLSPPSPGANDNASGVASALRMAERLNAEPPEALNVHVLLCGAGETTREGPRAFLRRHRKELGEGRTWLIDLDSTGSGAPRYVTREIPVLSETLDPTLGDMCEALSDGSPDRRHLDPGPAGIASLAALYGHAAVALTAREGEEMLPARHHSPADEPTALDGASVEAVAELGVELVRLLDRELARPSGSRATSPAAA